VVKGFNGLKDLEVGGFRGWVIFGLRDLGLQD